MKLPTLAVAAAMGSALATANDIKISTTAAAPSADSTDGGHTPPHNFPPRPIYPHHSDRPPHFQPRPFPSHSAHPGTSELPDRPAVYPMPTIRPDPPRTTYHTGLVPLSANSPSPGSKSSTHKPPFWVNPPSPTSTSTDSYFYPLPHFTSGIDSTISTFVTKTHTKPGFWPLPSITWAATKAEPEELETGASTVAYDERPTPLPPTES